VHPQGEALGKRLGGSKPPCLGSRSCTARAEEGARVRIQLFSRLLGLSRCVLKERRFSSAWAVSNRPSLGPGVQPLSRHHDLSRCVLKERRFSSAWAVSNRPSLGPGVQPLSRLLGLSRCVLKERRFSSAWAVSNRPSLGPGAAPRELRKAREFGAYFLTPLFWPLLSAESVMNREADEGVRAPDWRWR
jgi:hypothetical protein